LQWSSVIRRFTFFREPSIRDSAQPLQLNSGQNIDSHDIRLHPAELHAISGKVNGVNESAQAGKLSLLLYSRSFDIDDALPRSSQAQADGHFHFENVAPGDYTIVLEAPRFGTRQQSELAVQILQKQDLVYLIPNGWTPDDWRDLRWASVGKDGAFSVPDLRPGHYSVVAVDKNTSTPDEISLLSRDGVDVEVSPGERKQIEVDNSN
jgi:hypothetical protein